MLNGQYETVYTTTANVHRPNVQLSTAELVEVLEPMNAGDSPLMILQFYLEKQRENHWNKSVVVRPVFQLNDIGVNSTGRIVDFTN